jgi:hypothetical protein
MSIIPITSNDFAQLDEVDIVIARSIASGDPLIASDYGLQLGRAAAIKSLALAKLLFGIQSNWELFQAAGIEDDYENFVSAHLGITEQTARKYPAMWKAIFANDFVSDEIKLRLQSKPIKELLLLTAAVEEGSLTNDELETVIVADESKIRDMIKEARGKQTSSKSSIYISILMRDTNKYKRGTIIATQNGVQESRGWLDLDTEGFGLKAVARIINSAHIMERN